ncbi:MAG: hypothetical protein WEB19_03350 [Acidimicrobiia bacterium]
MTQEERGPGEAAPGARTLALTLAGLALVAFAAAAVGIPGRATYGARVSADEPYYLLSALSLAEDGDLDIADELDAERWRAFHEARLPEQTKPLPGGRRVAPHDPLLPVLLVPGVAWAGADGAKLTLALLAGALAALVGWVAVRRLGVPLLPAALTVGVFSASAPLAAYGHQVYPELPAALAVTVAVAALTGPLRRGGLVALVLAVVALPWLAVKTVPIAATLAALGLWRLWRRGDQGRALAAILVLLVAGGAYLLTYQTLYGGWTPYAAGDHFTGGELTVVGTSPNYPGRSRRLAGLLVDRNFGLAAWQPAWLLLVPALAWLLWRRPRGWAVLALPFSVGYLNATFVALTMHGWWFPGRQLVLVLPLAVLAIAWWLGRLRGRARRWALGATALLGALGVWSYAWLAAQAWTGRLTWIVDFTTTADPWYQAWRTLLPNHGPPM